MFNFFVAGILSLYVVGFGKFDKLRKKFHRKLQQKELQNDQKNLPSFSSFDFFFPWDAEEKHNIDLEFCNENLWTRRRKSFFLFCCKNVRKFYE